MARYLDNISPKEFAESNGLLLYVGVFGKSEEVLVINIPPIDKVMHFTYSCDSSVNTEPLFQMMKPKTSTIFVIVDG